MKLILHTDGGARGNPGPAAIGVVIQSAEGEVLKTIGESIGVATNNQAEYRALLRGMAEAAAMGAGSLVCYLDSELVVRQLNGQYKVKDAGLKPLAADALRQSNSFQEIKFAHVPREKNTRADELVNRALDDQEKSG